MAGNKNASGGLGLPRELWGLLLFFLAGFTALALVSYDPLDPGLNRLAAPGHKPANLAGMVGAYWAGLLVDMVGAAAFFLPLWLIWASLRRFFASQSVENFLLKVRAGRKQCTKYGAAPQPRG